MKALLIILFLLVHTFIVLAQPLPREISTYYYFGDLDTQFFAPQHILANKIKQIKEYRTDKKYADTALLMAEYFFTDAGYLSKAVSYDIHGKSSTSEYKQNSDNKITEVLYTMRGELTPSEIHEYKDGKLVKKISPYNADNIPSVEYEYNDKGLLRSQTNYFNGKATGQKTLYTYNSKGLLEKEENLYNSDTRECYNYAYDESGELIQIELVYNDNTKKNIINYVHYKNKYKQVQKTFYDNQLSLIQIGEFNKQGKLIKIVYDRRMRRKSRKANSFCGYNGPPLYQKTTYKYDSRGNCIQKKDYYNSFFYYLKINYEFDAQNNMIKAVEFEGLKKTDELMYKYK
ncbi:MAG: hypothetical protein IT234_01635 [Bacteroidia bacterium]|nr:hypothetical protein [Bacteroidia bacterium]